jgi:CRP-like cAMP-binding protein
VRRRVAEAETVLLHQGDVAAHALVLFSGWAMCSQLLPDGRRQILDLQLPGRIFGFELLARSDAPYSIVTLTSVSYGMIPREALLLLLRRRDHLASALLELVLDDYKGLYRRLAQMGHYKAEERVAAFLLDLRARLASLGLVRGERFTLPLTQQQLADLLGFNVVHVNRVLRRLHRGRLLTLKNRVVQIHDLGGLQRLARSEEAAAGSGKPPLAGA